MKKHLYLQPKRGRKEIFGSRYDQEVRYIWRRVKPKAKALAGFELFFLVSILRNHKYGVLFKNAELDEGLFDALQLHLADAAGKGKNEEDADMDIEQPEQQEEVGMESDPSDDDARAPMHVAAERVLQTLDVVHRGAGTRKGGARGKRRYELLRGVRKAFGGELNFVEDNSEVASLDTDSVPASGTIGKWDDQRWFREVVQRVGLQTAEWDAMEGGSTGSSILVETDPEFQALAQTNKVVVLKGAPGTGKTVQLILEAKRESDGAAGGEGDTNSNRPAAYVANNPALIDEVRKQIGHQREEFVDFVDSQRLLPWLYRKHHYIGPNKSQLITSVYEANRNGAFENMLIADPTAAAAAEQEDDAAAVVARLRANKTRLLLLDEAQNMPDMELVFWLTVAKNLPGLRLVFGIDQHQQLATGPRDKVGLLAAKMKQMGWGEPKTHLLRYVWRSTKKVIDMANAILRTRSSYLGLQTQEEQRLAEATPNANANASTAGDAQNAGSDVALLRTPDAALYLCATSVKSVQGREFEVVAILLPRKIELMLNLTRGDRDLSLASVLDGALGALKKQDVARFLAELYVAVTRARHGILFIAEPLNATVKGSGQRTGLVASEDARLQPARMFRDSLHLDTKHGHGAVAEIPLLLQAAKLSWAETLSELMQIPQPDPSFGQEIDFADELDVDGQQWTSVRQSLEGQPGFPLFARHVYPLLVAAGDQGGEPGAGRGTGEEQVGAEDDREADVVAAASTPLAVWGGDSVMTYVQLMHKSRRRYAGTSGSGSGVGIVAAWREFRMQVFFAEADTRALQAQIAHERETHAIEGEDLEALLTRRNTEDLFGAATADFYWKLHDDDECGDNIVRGDEDDIEDEDNTECKRRKLRELSNIEFDALLAWECRVLELWVRQCVECKQIATEGAYSCTEADIQKQLTQPSWTRGFSTSAEEAAMRAELLEAEFESATQFFAVSEKIAAESRRAAQDGRVPHAQAGPVSAELVLGSTAARFLIRMENCWRRSSDAGDYGTLCRVRLHAIARALFTEETKMTDTDHRELDVDMVNREDVADGDDAQEMQRAVDLQLDEKLQRAAVGLKSGAPPRGGREREDEEVEFSERVLFRLVKRIREKSAALSQELLARLRRIVLNSGGTEMDGGLFGAFVGFYPRSIAKSRRAHQKTARTLNEARQQLKSMNMAELMEREHILVQFPDLLAAFKSFQSTTSVSIQHVPTPYVPQYTPQGREAVPWTLHAAGGRSIVLRDRSIGLESDYARRIASFPTVAAAKASYAGDSGSDVDKDHNMEGRDMAATQILLRQEVLRRAFRSGDANGEDEEGVTQTDVDRFLRDLQGAQEQYFQEITSTVEYHAVVKPRIATAFFAQFMDADWTAVEDVLAEGRAAYHVLEWGPMVTEWERTFVTLASNEVSRATGQRLLALLVDRQVTWEPVLWRVEAGLWERLDDPAENPGTKSTAFSKMFGDSKEMGLRLLQVIAWLVGRVIDLAADALRKEVLPDHDHEHEGRYMRSCIGVSVSQWTSYVAKELAKTNVRGALLLSDGEVVRLAAFASGEMKALCVRLQKRLGEAVVEVGGSNIHPYEEIHDPSGAFFRLLLKEASMTRKAALTEMLATNKPKSERTKGGFPATAAKGKHDAGQDEDAEMVGKGDEEQSQSMTPAPREQILGQIMAEPSADNFPNAAPGGVSMDLSDPPEKWVSEGNTSVNMEELRKGMDSLAIGASESDTFESSRRPSTASFSPLPPACDPHPVASFFDELDRSARPNTPQDLLKDFATAFRGRECSSNGEWASVGAWPRDFLLHEVSAFLFGEPATPEAGTKNQRKIRPDWRVYVDTNGSTTEDAIAELDTVSEGAFREHWATAKFESTTSAPSKSKKKLRKNKAQKVVNEKNAAQDRSATFLKRLEQHFFQLKDSLPDPATIDPWIRNRFTISRVPKVTVFSEHLPLDECQYSPVEHPGVYEEAQRLHRDLATDIPVAAADRPCRISRIVAEFGESPEDPPLQFMRRRVVPFVQGTGHVEFSWLFQPTPVELERGRLVEIKLFGPPEDGYRALILRHQAYERQQLHPYYKRPDPEKSGSEIDRLAKASCAA
eukprot:g5170.t1